MSSVQAISPLRVQSAAMTAAVGAFEQDFNCAVDMVQLVSLDVGLVKATFSEIADRNTAFLGRIHNQWKDELASVNTSLQTCTPDWKPKQDEIMSLLLQNKSYALLGKVSTEMAAKLIAVDALHGDRQEKSST